MWRRSIVRSRSEGARVSDHSEFNRREILQKCLALGSLTLVGSNASAAMLLAFQENEVRKPTPPGELGPFYKKRAPEGSMLRAPGDPGMPLSVSGEILDTTGEKLSNATIEIWQADHLGHYDLDGLQISREAFPEWFERLQI